MRARIEATLDASLVVRGGDQAIGMPVAAVLERPRRTPPQSRLVVSVERLAWDSIVIDLGESARDGIVAPGATVPVSVGYNIIWPEASEVSVRTTAVLAAARGVVRSSGVTSHAKSSSRTCRSRRHGSGT